MTSTKVRYIAVASGAFSTQFHYLFTEHPRKELLEMLRAKRATKVYADTTAGATHVGYVINKTWWTLFAVEGRGPRSTT